MSLAIQQHFADIKECDDAVAVGVMWFESVPSLFAESNQHVEHQIA